MSEEKKCLNYYPFGMPMPGRQIVNGQPYRYAFQGQEKDPETGKEAFELRLWDGRIGRWLTTDPAGKGDSPYMGMYNNPLRYIDLKGADTLNVTNNAGDLLFKLDDGRTEVSTITAWDLYNQGTQWFSPEADNYMPLLFIDPKLDKNNSLKHFTWNDIIRFGNNHKSLTSYKQGGSGDWKQSKEGADGFFLVTVDGNPYWSDAIGQVPFAIAHYKRYGNINETVSDGIKYGEGKLIGGTPEIGNIYDKYFILRGAIYQHLVHLSYQNGGTNSIPSALLSQPIQSVTAKLYGFK